MAENAQLSKSDAVKFLLELERSERSERLARIDRISRAIAEVRRLISQIGVKSERKEN